MKDRQRQSVWKFPKLPQINAQERYSLDDSILACSHSGMVAHPDHALNRPVMRGWATVAHQNIRFCIRSTQVEYPCLLFLTTRQKMRGGRRDGNTADDMVVREGVQRVACIRVPDLPVSNSMMLVRARHASKRYSMQCK